MHSDMYIQGCNNEWDMEYVPVGRIVSYHSINNISGSIGMMMICKATTTKIPIILAKCIQPATLNKLWSKTLKLLTNTMQTLISQFS